MSSADVTAERSIGGWQKVIRRSKALSRKAKLRAVCGLEKMRYRDYAKKVGGALSFRKNGGTLDGGFIWDETDEGHGFWYYTYHALARESSTSKKAGAGDCGGNEQ